MTREYRVNFVMTAWKMLDHQKIAATRYTQTGPRMPFKGPILRENVYKDLRDVWDEVDPALGLQRIGQKLQDDAKLFVETGWPSKWSKWEHVKRLIIEHDDEDDPLPEGMELAAYDITRGDSDDEASEIQNEDSDGVHELEMTYMSLVLLRMMMTPLVLMLLGLISSGSVEITVAQARQVLIDEARRQKNDVFLR